MRRVDTRRSTLTKEIAAEELREQQGTRFCRCVVEGRCDRCRIRCKAIEDVTKELTSLLDVCNGYSEKICEYGWLDEVHYHRFAVRLSPNDFIE